MLDKGTVNDGMPFERFLSSEIHDVLGVCAELRPPLDISVVPR